MLIFIPRRTLKLPTRLTIVLVFPLILSAFAHLWNVPRLLMGIFAVVDTFLIHKIAEKRYNRYVAFISSILFAIMPLTWMTRRIYLDSILLPFLLLSVLFAVYYTRAKPKSNEKSKDRRRNSDSKIMVLLSGIFLGLAIFTKIPAFTMIPLVIGILIYNYRALKSLALWFIPLLLIPAIYPGYAILQGEFDEWRKDISYQADRIPVGMLENFKSLFIFDPVLTVLGIAGIIFTAIKKDFLPLICVVPFAIFLYLNEYSYAHYWIVALPAFSIAATILILDITKMMSRKIKVTQSCSLLSFPQAICYNRIMHFHPLHIEFGFLDIGIMNKGRTLNATFYA